MDRTLPEDPPGRGEPPATEAVRPRPSLLRVTLFFPAALLSLAATALLQLRVHLADNSSFLFLSWNLGLAWVPYLLALAAAGLDSRGWGRLWNLAPLAGLSLLFLPNAPYLVTDLVHLKARAGVPVWLDALVLFLYGATGWLLGLGTLHALRSLARRRFGRWASNLFVISAAFASGFGVYLGRIWRFNSWDLLTVPGLRLHQIAGQLRAPGAHPEMVALTLAFGTLLLVSYAAFARHVGERGWR